MATHSPDVLPTPTDHRQLLFVCVCVCGVAELIQLDLRLPLGMLIEVEDAEGGGSIAGQWYQKTNVIITDALPGYSAYGNVQKGDVS